ncbi:MAG TPA: glycerophosphodiester phosphodiesterase [Bacillota bacterium]|nr:glycerophosphodiester phosphodiesterase [Bacillota bacterium]
MAELKRKPLNIAHRGASAYAPENTMPAFQLAAEIGCDGLEFDVQLTMDGLPIVIHDEQLDRLAGVCALVSDLTWAQVQSLDVGKRMGGKWTETKIPTLEEVLSVYSHLYLNVELKFSPHMGIEEKVVELINKYCSKGSVIVSSFYHPYLRKVKELDSHLQTGLLYTQEPIDILDYARQIGVNAVHPEYTSLTRDRVVAFHQAGLAVNTWTVNQPEDIERCMEIGVNGIITNYPNRVHSFI